MICNNAIFDNVLYIENKLSGTFTNGKKVFSRCSISLDIETTKSNDFTFMYVTQIAINNKTFIFRKWIDVYDALYKIYNFYKKIDLAVMVSIANLGYEMAFMLPVLEKTFKLNVFADVPKKPIFIKCYDWGTEINKENKNEYHMMFIDTLRISGTNLKTTAKNFCRTQKLDGEKYDYAKIRNSKTPLTEYELQYAENDVLICNEFFQYILSETIDKGKKFPFTSTGILRNDVKKAFNEECKKDKSLRKKVVSCFPKNAMEYMEIVKYLFTGGIVHSNATYTDKIINDVVGIDFTSSYPFVMNTENYPLSSFYQQHGVYSLSQLEKLLKSDKTTENAMWYVDIALQNFTSITQHDIFSFHKCKYIENEIISNGRVHFAGEIRIMITNVDYEYLKHFYSWSGERIYKCMVCNDCYKLPNYLLKSVNENGIAKQKLKFEGKSNTAEYQLSKGKFNSGYGLTVQQLNLSSYTYCNNDWVETDQTSYKEIVGKQFLSVFWGIYITAYARRNLMLALLDVEKLGGKVVYYDTDSLYITNFNSAVEKYVNDYNTKTLQLNADKHIKNEFLNELGTFDREKPCTFKTLGAKRYIKVMENCDIKATIAGLPKKAFNIALEKSGKNVFDFFTDKMLIDTILAGKKCSKYINCDTLHKPQLIKSEITDDYGNSEIMYEFSCVTLEGIPFNLNLGDFAKYLEKLR